jgi:hypothetical protein
MLAVAELCQVRAVAGPRVAGFKIGRITTSGTVTEYVIPTANSYPQAIVAGPDGNMWFTEAATNKIGRITDPFPAGSGNAVRRARR